MTTVVRTSKEKSHFHQHLSYWEEGRERPEVRQMRQEARLRFEQTGFPTSRTEDWRFTSVADLLRQPFEPATLPELPPAAQDLEPHCFGEEIRLVFVNGQYVAELSRLAPLPQGVICGSLREALAAEAQTVLPYLGHTAQCKDQVFTALNTACFRDGACLVVPQGTALEQPIHLLHVAVPGPVPWASYPRHLLLLHPGSRVRVIESYVGMTEEGADGQPTFTDAVTEVVIGDEAVLDHIRIQEESRRAFHFSNFAVVLGRASRLTTHLISLGSGWARNETRVRFGGEGGEATVNGLYVGRGTQHVDNHTVIDHAVPACASHELYKGILDGKAHGVFNGKIFVRPDAQKTDAKQTNQTLLLSEDAVINTKPQLEIYADDVKCTHGATVGSLNAEALFYLRTRGLALAQARDLLTFAFANDILSRVEDAAVRERFERFFTRQFGGALEAAP